MEEFELEKRIRVFVGDNVGNINTTIKVIMMRFRPNEASSRCRRARYFGHIINLAAKAFLLGNNYEAFSDKVLVAEQVIMRDE